MEYNTISMNFLEKNKKTSRFKLQRTSDYGMFKFYKSNRPVSQANLNNIEESIRKYGLLQPIITTSSGYILDGQHRFEALKRLKLPIDYIVSYNADDYVVIESNKIRKGWTVLDYVDYWSSNDNYHISLLKKQISKWSKYTSIGSISNAYTRESTVNRLIQNGAYKIDLNFGNDIMSDCLFLTDVSDKAFSSKFIRALKMIKLRNKNFDINRLAKNANYKMLKIYNNEADTYDNIVEVYNYKLSKKNRIN